MKKKCYVVLTTFISQGTFFVYARNEKSAGELVKERCWIEHVKLYPRIDNDGIGWVFGSGRETSIGSIKLANNDRVLLRKLRGNRITKIKGRNWFAVEVAMTCEPGKFYIDANDADEARRIVEEQCGRKNLIITTELPLGEVYGEFPQNASKIIEHVGLPDSKVKCVDCGEDVTLGEVHYLHDENVLLCGDCNRERIDRSYQEYTLTVSKGNCKKIEFPAQNDDDAIFDTNNRLNQLSLKCGYSFQLHQQDRLVYEGERFEIDEMGQSR